MQFRRVLAIDPQNAAALSALQLVAVRSGHSDSGVVGSPTAGSSATADFETEEGAGVGRGAESLSYPESEPTTEVALVPSTEPEAVVEPAPEPESLVSDESVQPEPEQHVESATVAVDVEVLVSESVIETEPDVPLESAPASESTEVDHDVVPELAGAVSHAVAAVPSAAVPKVRRFSVKPPPPYVPAPQVEEHEEEPMVDEHGKPLGLVQRMALKYQRQAEKSQLRNAPQKKP